MPAGGDSAERPRVRTLLPCHAQRGHRDAFPELDEPCRPVLGVPFFHAGEFDEGSAPIPRRGVRKPPVELGGLALGLQLRPVALGCPAILTAGHRRSFHSCHPLVGPVPLAGPGLHQGLSRALDFGAVHNAEVARQPKSFFLSPDLNEYLLASSSPLDPLLAELARETSELGPVSRMQVPPEQGALLTVLAAATGARRAVEVGTFTGYSALCIARGLPADGHLLCLDVSDEWTSMARRYWARANLSDRIELRLGPAADSLAALPAEPIFDFAFVDADKTGYSAYIELLAPRLRPNGLLLLDNVLQSGRVLDPAAQDANVRAIRDVNARLGADPRFQVVVLPVADGLTMARRM